MFSCHGNYPVGASVQLWTPLLLLEHNVAHYKDCNCNKFRGAQQQKLQRPPSECNLKDKNTIMQMICLSSAVKMCSKVSFVIMASYLYAKRITPE